MQTKMLIAFLKSSANFLKRTLLFCSTLYSLAGFSPYKNFLLDVK